MDEKWEFLLAGILMVILPGLLNVLRWRNLRHSLPQRRQPLAAERLPKAAFATLEHPLKQTA